MTVDETVLDKTGVDELGINLQLEVLELMALFTDYYRKKSYFSSLLAGEF